MLNVKLKAAIKSFGSSIVLVLTAVGLLVISLMILKTDAGKANTKPTLKKETPAQPTPPPQSIVVIQKALSGNPFGVSNSVAFSYRSCPNTVNTYVIIGTNHSEPIPKYIQNEWPHFGNITKTEYLGPTVNEDSQVFRVTIEKFDCWK